MITENSKKNFAHALSTSIKKIAVQHLHYQSVVIIVYFSYYFPSLLIQYLNFTASLYIDISLVILVSEVHSLINFSGQICENNIP